MKKLGITIAAFCSLIASALGSAISYTVLIPDQNTNWTNVVQLHQFVSSFGKLTNVVINVGFTNHRQAAFYSYATNDVTYDIAYTCTTRLMWPDATECGSEVHTEWAAGTLGVSGGTYAANLTNTAYFNKSSCVDFAPAKIAPYLWVGGGYIPFTISMTGEIDVGSMDFTQIFPVFITDGSASVTVTYFYTAGTGTGFPCH